MLPMRCAPAGRSARHVRFKRLPLGRSDHGGCVVGMVRQRRAASLRGRARRHLADDECVLSMVGAARGRQLVPHTRDVRCVGRAPLFVVDRDEGSLLTCTILLFVLLHFVTQRLRSRPIALIFPQGRISCTAYSESTQIWQRAEADVRPASLCSHASHTAIRHQLHSVHGQRLHGTHGYTATDALQTLMCTRLISVCGVYQG